MYRFSGFFRTSPIACFQITKARIFKTKTKESIFKIHKQIPKCAQWNIMLILLEHFNTVLSNNKEEKYKPSWVFFSLDGTEWFYAGNHEPHSGEWFPCTESLSSIQKCRRMIFCIYPIMMLWKIIQNKTINISFKTKNKARNMHKGILTNNAALRGWILLTSTRM